MFHQVNEKENYRIDYEHFEKETKHPKVILADSALSMKQKRTILTQEGLRILRNTKIELGEEIRNGHLNKFMIKMKNSGYDQKFRTEIVDSAMKAFDIMKEKDRKGTNPLFRDRNWKAEERLVREKKIKNEIGSELTILSTKVYFLYHLHQVSS